MANAARLVAVVLGACFATACGTTSLAESKASDSSPAKPSAARLAKVQVRVAEAALEQHDPETALAMYERAHRTAPNDAGPLFGKGVALMALHRYREAEVALQAALERAPDRTEIREQLGKALVSNGKYSDGLQEFQAVLAKRRSASLLNKIGVTYEMMGNSNAAQENYREALKLEPENLTARNNLALSLAVSGDYDTAVAEMERVAANPKASDRYRRNLAFIYGLSGRKMDNTVPAAVRSAADKSWNEEFFRKIRERTKTGDRRAILALLSQPRSATQNTADIPSAAPEMPSMQTEAPSTPAGSAAPAQSAAPADSSPQVETTAPATLPPAGAGHDAATPPGPSTAAEPQSQGQGAPTATAATSGPGGTAGTPTEGTESAAPKPYWPGFPSEEPDQAKKQAKQPEGAKQSGEQLALQTPPENPAPGDMPAMNRKAKAQPLVHLQNNEGIFRIQLGSYATTRPIPAAIARLNAKGADLLPNGHVEVLYTNNLYQLRSQAFTNRVPAVEACEALKERKVKCFVSKHRAITDQPGIAIASAGDPALVAQFVASLASVGQGPEATAEPAMAGIGASVPETGASGESQASAPATGSAMPSIPAAQPDGAASVAPEPATGTSDTAMATTAGPQAAAPENPVSPQPAPMGATIDTAQPDVSAPVIAPPEFATPEHHPATAATGTTVASTGPGAIDESASTGAATAAGAGGMWQYRVQLAAYLKESNLKRGKVLLSKQAGSLMPSVDLLVQTVNGVPTAVPYRVRSRPLASKEAAEHLCTSLRGKGLDCLVILHSKKRWRPLG